METKTAAIEMRNITKRFGPVLANDKVWLNIYRGEILALLGENGSGKTTLMNMLSGIYFPDEGEIKIDGKEVVIRSPKDAFDNGIGMIHQHFKLVDVLTAAENIVLGLPGKLDRKAASAKIREICDKYGFSVDPAQKIYDMSVSQKQTVEIVKVLYRGADILILDEPTAVLTPQETDKLFAVLRNMRNDGKAIVIITHKMHEVEALSDRVAILRHGQFIGDMLTAYAVRGLDIHSSYTIYDLINRQKKAGVAVIFVGEDLDVLLELCDRILVLCGGKVSGTVSGRGAEKREVGMMMTKLGGQSHE